MIKMVTLLIPMIAVAVYILLRAAESVEEENRMLEAGEEAVRVYNDALAERTREIRKFRHDVKGLLQAIDAEGGDAAAEYEMTAVRRSMPFLEAIIDLKRRQCGDEDILFEILLDDEIFTVPDTEEETDLCRLVQNLLDNAYEANLRISDPDKRYMQLIIKREQGSLAVTASNRVKEGENVSFITRKNDPRMHGIGMRIIDDTVKKYGGSKTIRTDIGDHILTITAVLKMKPQKTDL